MQFLKLPARFRARRRALAPGWWRRSCPHTASLACRRPQALARKLAPLRRESGSAVVDFVLVGVLVVFIALALFQLVLGLYVRNVLTDAASAGARRAALVGGSEAQARERVQELAAAALTDGYVNSVQVHRVRRDGLAVVEVQVKAPLPVIGLLGPSQTLQVRGHALDESALAPLEENRDA